LSLLMRRGEKYFAPTIVCAKTETIGKTEPRYAEEIEAIMVSNLPLSARYESYARQKNQNTD
jgi:hypothetical protein